MPDYSNYYKRAIDLEKNGFKLVLGGTGLGKTSAIKKLIKEYEKKEQPRKFIYIANRIQLLNELAEELPAKQVAHQKSDFELLSEIDIKPLFKNHIIQSYIERSKHSRFPVVLSDIKRAYQTIVDNKNTPMTDSFKDFIARPTSIVMNFVRRVVQYESRESEENYQKLINNKIILSLFPYIDFKNNSDKKILLVTIQKAFRGFFDGNRRVSLFNLDNSKKNDNGDNIIFFDEFDFLENDLISLISEDTDVPLPFNFVAQFYSAMENNKLPLPNYPEDEDIRKKIKLVTEEIKKLKKQGINYPAINHFTCTQDERIEADIEQLKKEKKQTRKKATKDNITEQIKDLEYNRIKGKSIFQTRYTIVNSKLFLNPDTRKGSFDLTKEDNDLSAFTLFRYVNSAVVRIIHLFKELESEHPTYYLEILRHCFETSDIFQKAIKTAKHTPRNKRTLTNYDALHYNGFSLYEIQDLRQETDRNEILFNHFSIHTTPEKILLHLAENNFVFGLSATANISRKLRNFDLDWLREQLGNNYIDATKNNNDQQDIHALNKKKSEYRDNQIGFELTRTLDGENEYQQKLKEFINLVARTDEEIFGSDKQGYRKLRVTLFFSTLLNIIEKSVGNKDHLEKDTHLLFFSSFKQIEAVLNETTEDDTPLFVANKQSSFNQIFEFYEVSIQKTDFIVLFYDAEKGKNITKEESIKTKYYELFWQEKPVVIVTTYPSAGNGINLQYYKTKADFIHGKNKSKEERDRKVDFKNIHLLDSPYFFFDTVKNEQTSQEQNASIKKNIYYYTKLLATKTPLTDTDTTIERHFERHLENIRATFNPFNQTYLKSEDGVLNQLAVFIQAIGRVERVWIKMENQHIYFREEVYKVFEKFCTSSEFAKIKKQVLPYFSANMQSLIKQIEDYSKEQGLEIDDWKEEHLNEINTRNRELTSQLLSRIRLLNEGKLSKNEAKEVRKEWNNLRLFGLKHQFDETLLQKYKAIFETEYYENGEIRINKQNQIISNVLVSYEYDSWELNRIYDTISGNEIVRNYFANRGYELQFGTSNKFFTPYFYQAILSGAIGEEAIKAILKELDQISTFELIKQPIQPIPIAPDSEIPNELFEVADLKIHHRAYFIDCKNYSEQTLFNFNLPQTDPLWRPKLNEKYFAEKAIEKYNKINLYYKGQPSKLIYINFTGSNIRTLRYFKVSSNELLETTSFKDADIIVLQGVLSRSDTQNSYNTYTAEFEKFVIHLNKDLNQ